MRTADVERFRRAGMTSSRACADVGVGCADMKAALAD
jgi:hypothetical protein